MNRKLIAWAFAITGIFSITLWLIGQKNQGLWTLFKPTTVTFDLKPQKLPVVLGDMSTADAVLVAQLQSQTATLAGTFSIYVYRPKKNTGYGLAADKIMPAAGMMKVPIMIAVLKRIEEGKMKLDDHPVGTTDTGANLTVANMLVQMGQNSDNTTPVIFSKMLGGDYIQTTINSLGMINTSFSQNTTTALDLNQMWRSLYETKYLGPDSLKLLEQDLKGGSGSGVVTSADGKTILYITILNDGVGSGQVQEKFPDLVKTIWNYESLK